MCPSQTIQIITFVALSPPTVLCLHFNSQARSTLVFFCFIRSPQFIICSFSTKGTQCSTASKRLLLHPPALRGTRNISSCSSWRRRQGVAPLGASLVGGVWWPGGCRAVASPQVGRPPSTCVPPALPADESHALH